MKIEHKVIPNSQRISPDWGGKINRHTFCMVSAFMTAGSHWIPEMKDGSAIETRMLDSVSTAVGGWRGAAERVMAKMPWVTKPTHIWWPVCIQALNDEFVAAKLPVRYELVEGGTIEQFLQDLKRGPLPLGLTRLPGLPDGHIVCAVGGEKSDVVRLGRERWQIWTRDPYGIPPYKSDWQRTGGALVYYYPSELQKYSKLRPRLRYARPVK